MTPHTSMGDNKKLFFHGVWVAGLKISDRLVKSIAMEFAQKPSRSCTLTLTLKGLDLQIANGDTSFDSSAGVKPDKSQHVLFSALREFSINQHNQHCLMVVYVDAKNRFSVLVFSCDNPRTLWEITSEFKEIRNRKAIQSLSSPKVGANGSDDVELNSGNWTLRQQVPASRADEKPMQIHAGSFNGAPETLRASQAKPALPPVYRASDALGQHQQHQLHTDQIQEQQQRVHQNNDGDAEHVVASIVCNGGGLEDGFERELVNTGASGSPERFNVCLQVDGVETSAENDGVFFSGSFRSKSTNQQPDVDPYSQETISAEEYHSVRNRTMSNGVDGETNSAREDLSRPSGTNDDGPNGTSEKAVAQMSNGSAFALRNVGTQTEPVTPSTPQRGRYTKKPLNASLSNQYKEKVAAVRKKSGSGNGPSSVASTNGTPTVTSGGGTSVATVPSYTNTGQGELLQATPAAKSVTVMRPKSTLDSVAAQHRPVSKSLSSPPLLITSRSTVSRPIETVYSPRLQYAGPDDHGKQRSHEAEQQRRHGQGVYHASGGQRVVVLPGRQAVRVYHPVPLQRQYLSATPGGRVRRSSNSSTNSYAGAISGTDGFDSRNSSRNNSLRARGGSAPHQTKRLVSYPPSPRQLTHLS